MFSYLNEELNLFRDREDPCAVYVILKNRLHENLLKDFYLHNAIALAGRLYNALPDKYLNARHYINEVQKVLQTKVGDHTFTRKMGLNISSMLLGLEHQRKFDCLMARIEDSPILKEPFDRETRGKMVSYQKQALDGLDKFQQLGALSKKNSELLGMYATNKIQMPRPKVDGRIDRKRRPAPERRSAPEQRAKVPRPSSQNTKVKREDGNQRRRLPKNDTKEVEIKRTEKGEKKRISNVHNKDLQKLIDLAKVKMEGYYNP